MNTYTYTLTLTDGKGNPHIVEGTVGASKGGFLQACQEALSQSLARLVGPHAQVETCGGPFTVVTFALEKDEAGADYHVGFKGGQ